MQTAPLPVDERNRLLSLKKLQILDTPSEERFDRITKLATRIFAVPISTISLIDANREWYKSVCGLDHSEGDRAISFCAHAILTNEMLIISDTKKDARFFDNPMVIGKPYIRFYAGMPIMSSDGQRVGVFCIKDTKPRTFSNTEKNSFIDLAAWVELEINSRNLHLILAEQKKIQAKLSTQTEEAEKVRVRGETFLKSIGDGLVEIDIEGRIIAMSQAAGELLGVDVADCIGRRYNEIWSVKNESGEKVLFDNRPIQIALTTGKKITTSISNACYYVRNDETQFPVAIIVTPVIINNEIIGVVDVFRDVTNEKEIDKTKTEFVSLASHQLRTPAGALQWGLEMLLAGDYGVLTNEQKKVLQEAYATNTRMIELINGLLNVSRIEMGVFIIELVPTDFAKLCDDVLIELESERAQKEIIITKYFDPDLLNVSADPKLLHIIFQNFISNSINYTPLKGKVGIHLMLTDNDIVISVSNNGEPIPKSEQSKIFQKMFRASNAQQQNPNGNGLGLYIVKKIVENGGGQIWFTSKKGEDTVFACSFPRSGMRAKSGNKLLT